jgi:hypothetical protein
MSRVRLTVRGGPGSKQRMPSMEVWEQRGAQWHMVGGDHTWDGDYEPINAEDFTHYTQIFDLREDIP